MSGLFHNVTKNRNVKLFLNIKLYFLFCQIFFYDIANFFYLLYDLVKHIKGVFVWVERKL